MARILVIEDNEDMRSLLQLLLAREGYEVLVAANGEEGMRQLRAAPAELVITDILMPGIGGLGVLLELQRDFPHVKTIAMSGGFRRAGGDDLAITQVLGVQRTLNKPFSRDDLLHAVRQVLTS
jgi:CheY-like chemotaxis protein